MKNTPFSNTFKARFKEIKDGGLVISKKLVLTPDDSLIIRDATDKIITLAELTAGDALEVYVSSSEPHNLLSVRVLPSNESPAEVEAAKAAKK